MSGKDDSQKQLEEIQNKIALNKATAELVESEKALAAKMKESTAAEEEKTKLQEQKQLIDAQIALSEAKKTQITSMLPKGQSTGVEGEITTTANFGYATELIAYKLVEENSKIIADAIREKELTGIENFEPRILVVKDLNFAQGDFPLLLIDGLMDNYNSSILAQLKNNGVEMPAEPQKPSVPTGKPHREVATALAAAGVLSAIPSLISGGLSVAADVLRFFKGDYNVKGKEFSIDEEALIASITGKITSSELTESGKPWNGKVMVCNFNSLTTSELVSKLTELLKLKMELDMSVANLKAKVAEAKAKGDEITKLQAEIEELTKKAKALEGTEKESIQKSLDSKKQEKTSKTNALNELNKSLQNVNKSVLDSEALLKSFDSFFASITASTDNKPSMLVDAVLREYIRSSHISHLLHLKVCSKGGEAITIKKPLSIGGGDTSYISGIVLAFVLAKITGEVEAAGSCSELVNMNFKLGYGKDDEKPTLNRIITATLQTPTPTDPPAQNAPNSDKGGFLGWISKKR
ncbi:MAG: hypothetical protein NWE93_05505 [Candidatus Bathyarchaeota archaeon]|nr:hypothetical protein [Candidatus Bathyarchaeota archaeon]